jgi:hypothetical protein
MAAIHSPADRCARVPSSGIGTAGSKDGAADFFRRFFCMSDCWNAAESRLCQRMLKIVRLLQVGKDEQDREDCGRVGWHLVPGVF